MPDFDKWTGDVRGTPDFEQIARASLHLTAGAYGMAGSHITVDALVEQLRQVWNARGAADIATIEATLACRRIDWIEQVRRLDR